MPDLFTTDVNFTGIISPTDSTKQNDYNPSGLATAYEIRWNGTASTGITGLSGGVSGREIQITNVTTDYLLWLESQNTASSAANRFMLPEGRPAFLMPGDSIILRYDGTTTKWRVKTWGNRGITMGLNLFDDFLGTAGTTSPVFLTSVTGTGASVQSFVYLENTTEKPFGTIQADTGTTNTGRASITSGSNSNTIPTLGPALFVSRLATEAAVTATETFTITTGFAEFGTHQDGIVWEYRWNGSAAEWSQTRYVTNIPTRSATGSPSVDTNYIWLLIFMNAAWTRADFIYSQDSISFTKSDSPTTGLPNSTQNSNLLAVQIIKSAGTTQRNVSIDFCGFRYDYVRG
jgi:hypothetical protein